MTDPPRLHAKAAAAYIRPPITVGTLRNYLAKAQPKANPFPQPDGYDRDGMYWYPATLDAWMADRPGPGTRTDLTRPKPADPPA